MRQRSKKKVGGAVYEWHADFVPVHVVLMRQQ
jgi:hypothetical protein